MTDQPPSPTPHTQPRRMPGMRSGDAGYLHPGEQITMRARIHPGIYWKAMSVFFISIILLLLVFNLGVFLLLVSFIMFVFAYMTKHYLLLVLTDQRVILRYGILNLETVQLHYNRIESVEVAWTPMGRILGYATVLITGTGSRVTGVPYVGNAIAFRSTIDDLISVQDEKPQRVEVVNTGAAKA